MKLYLAGSNLGEAKCYEYTSDNGLIALEIEVQRALKLSQVFLYQAIYIN
jgi:hypothetical protein